MRFGDWRMSLDTCISEALPPEKKAFIPAAARKPEVSVVARAWTWKLSPALSWPVPTAILRPLFRVIVSPAA